VGGSYPGQPLRLYTQTLDGGHPLPLRTNVYLSDAAIAPDGRRIAGRPGQTSIAVLSLDTLQVSSVPNSTSLLPLAWSGDGARILTAASSGMTWNLLWVDAAGNRSASLATLTRPELSGMVDLAGIVATPSGKAWVTSWRHLISQLYVVDGWS
jgi:hypothetical protein